MGESGRQGVVGRSRSPHGPPPQVSSGVLQRVGEPEPAGSQVPHVCGEGDLQQRVHQPPHLLSPPPPPPTGAQKILQGGGDFARGEFRGENFAVKKGDEIFPGEILG